MNQQWLDDLKIAIIDEDVENIDNLCSSMPHFDGLEETIEAQALIKEALIVVKEDKDKMGEALKNMKKQSAFLSLAQESTKFSLSS